MTSGRKEFAITETMLENPVESHEKRIAENLENKGE